MYSLYVDSTSGLVVGLLDSNFKWVEYHDTNEKKPSEVIHIEIFNLIKKYDLDLKNINFFFSAGPGSYTGMRLGEGLAQVFEWESRNVYSFYHFDVPLFFGVEEGFWVTSAFKEQVFVYNWSLSKNIKDKELINSKDFKIIDPNLGYTLSSDAKDFSGLKNTKDLIKDRPEKIFSQVYSEKLRVAPYYFRTLEEEFK